MIAAIEVKVEKARLDKTRQFFADPWFIHPITEIIQIGHEYPTYLVLSCGVSIHMKPGHLVYYEDCREYHDRR